MSIRIVADPNRDARNRRNAAMQYSAWYNPESRSRELRREQEERRRRHQIEQRNAAEHARITRELRETVRRADASAREARAAIADVEKRMQQEIDRNNARTRRAMAENDAKMKKQLAQERERVQGEMRALESRMRQDVQNNMMEIRQELAQVDERVREMEMQQQTLLKKAEEYENGAEALLMDVRKNYEYEKLVPGGMRKLENICRKTQQQLELAEQIPANSSAALSDARDSFMAVLEFRRNVQLGEEIWMQHESAAAAALDAVESHMEASRLIQLDIGGGETAAVKVQHFSNGDLSRLAQRLDQLKDNFEEAASIEDLDMVKEAAQQLEHDLSDTCSFAVEAFLLSQERADLAEDISERLGEMGLNVMDFSYQEDDQRAAFRLLMENPHSGFHMAVTLMPKLDQDGMMYNELETEILNYGSNSAEESCALAREIIGIVTGDMGQMRIVEDSGIRMPNSSPQENMQKFRTAKAEIPKPKHVSKTVAKSEV